TSGAHQLFVEMSSQLEATAGAVLRVTVTHMLYRVTEEVLPQVYNVYGADSVVVFARAGYVEALVGFLSGGDAEQARDTTHGRQSHQHIISTPAITEPASDALTLPSCPTSTSCSALPLSLLVTHTTMDDVGIGNVRAKVRASPTDDYRSVFQGVKTSSFSSHSMASSELVRCNCKNNILSDDEEFQCYHYQKIQFGSANSTS
uniref:PTBP1-like RNA recognition motif 2 domain-containing protein n=1 Tax=Setaria italica TaxID=4555 RepID=K3ZF55_SETIT